MFKFPTYRMRATCNVHLVLHDLNTTRRLGLGVNYKFDFHQYLSFFRHILHLLKATSPHQTTSKYVQFLMRHTRFYTDTKSRAKLQFITQRSKKNKYSKIEKSKQFSNLPPPIPKADLILSCRTVTTISFASSDMKRAHNSFPLRLI